MSAKKGLGRGFESLIPTDLLDDTFDPTSKQDENLSDLRELPISKVKPDPDQPRREFDQDALDDLASSIKQHGVLQPIIVVRRGEDYQIVAGERRYRASKLAGQNTIPAIIRTLDGQHKLELSLIENIQRRDLNPIETATAYLKLKDQFNLSLDKIAKRVGKNSVSTISNTMRLLKLPKKALLAIAEGKLTEGQARPLIGHDEKLIEGILARIIDEQWSARKIEQYVVNLKKEPNREEGATKPESLHEAQIKQLRDKLKTDVNIRVNTRGAGQITIKFKNSDELKRIQSLLD